MEQFEDLLVRILLLAACVSFVSMLPIKLFPLVTDWAAIMFDINNEAKNESWIL